MNYDDWKTESPPDTPTNKCKFCGELCADEFCSSDCIKAYKAEN